MIVLIALGAAASLRALGAGINRSAASVAAQILSLGGPNAADFAEPRFPDLPSPPVPSPQPGPDSAERLLNFVSQAGTFVLDNFTPVGDVETLLDPDASVFDKVLAGTSVAASIVPIPGVGPGVKGLTKLLRLGVKHADELRDVERTVEVTRDIERGVGAVGDGRRTGKAVASQEPRATRGETPSTRNGKQIHKERADQRRSSGEWDEVNESIRGPDGERIEVPKRVDRAGRPLDDRVQTVQPDAVSYKRGEILDDKPIGRDISKDRQEIIRFITAYKEKTGELPKRVLIDRYDPATGKTVRIDVYDPQDFLPIP